MDWDLSPVGKGAGMPGVGEHSHLAGWMELANCFSSEDKRFETRRKAVGAGISSFVAVEYAMQGENSVPKATKISM